MAAVRRLPVLRTLGETGKPWNRADKLTLGLGIGTLVLAALGLWQTYSNNNKKPALRVAAVSAAAVQNIDAQDLDQDGRVIAPNPDGVPGDRVDITVVNSGSGEALISRADLEFSVATRLARCREVGGEVQIAANYDVKVPAPWGDPFGYESLRTPFVVEREMRFVVAPGKHERFTLTVGPETIPEMSMPWLYSFTLTLRHDNGAKLEVGKVSMLGIGGQTGAVYAEDGSPVGPGSPSERDCLRNNLKAVRMHQLAATGIRSEALKDYSDELANYAEDVGLTWPK
ncbi:hypothetical protein OWR29_10115 [Actinoplanes sp. Pm04-4]|uniref:Uncharacterized protein n=1 Tax=Paractinoplanes pyxinae TaxID=2997416 RepID=A0ABT4AVU3_9ACTN|nr:hypothetical protein [Actinoplanes pyxinae]MCY1138351.1 hypothetical protein [Actinoplanes pyxinae]